MHRLPEHKFSKYFESEVHLRNIGSPANKCATVPYAHQDDYHIFGLIKGGYACGIIDFNKLNLSSGDVFLIQPGQVHRFINSENAEGWLLFADSSFIGNAEKRIFDDFSLFGSSFQIDRQRRNELDMIATLLEGRIECVRDNQTKITVRRLVETFIGIIAEAATDINIQKTNHSRRHIEIVLSFRRLLADHLAENHKPSYYASLLNLSGVYLNEVVKDVTGMSATQYIRAEIVLKAKRLLVHTDLTVKEIAGCLGVDDYAYFSRMFTQSAGISPSSFRQRNLE